ncbi:MAG: ABC-type Co2+ transport system, periplasmic component [Bryobacterales bacterium]|nr:ABC-type Co2+ transport system, periplasmic component [Bryobacterales bacterium]
MKRTAFFLGLLLLITAPLFAHDLYIMPETFRPAAGQLLTVALRHGDAFPESEGPPSLQRLGDTRLLGGPAAIPLGNFREAHKALVTVVTVTNQMPGSLVLTASLSANTREYDAPKFAAYVRDEGLIMIAEYLREHGKPETPIKEIYSKYAKAALRNGASSSFATQPVGMKIEIVPQVDPSTLKAGESLMVQVLFEGKPAAGVSIDSTSSTGGPGTATPLGKTDRKGLLSVPVSSGRSRLNTGFSRRYSNQAVANWETFFATLTFEVGGN